MKTKFNTVDDAISYLIDLMMNRFGYSYTPPRTITTSNKIGGYHRFPAKHTFNDDPTNIVSYERVKRTPEEKEKYLKKKEKDKNRFSRRSAIEIMENEEYKLVEKKVQKPNTIMSLEIMRKIESIISQFPNDFLCIWKDAYFGRGFTLFYLQSFGMEPVSQEIVFRFLPRHCKTKSKDKVFEIASRLEQSENNKKLLNLFKSVQIHQYQTS